MKTVIIPKDSPRKSVSCAGFKITKNEPVEVSDAIADKLIKAKEIVLVEDKPKAPAKK